MASSSDPLGAESGLAPFALRDQASGSGPTCRHVLASLPSWFGDPEAVEDYVAVADRSPTVIASARGTDIGLASVIRHGAHSAEVYVMGVVPEWHRRGVGRAILERVESDLARGGIDFLQVKTLSSAHPDPGYRATRAFYEAYGFRVLEELPTLWSPENPAVLMVKAMGGVSRSGLPSTIKEQWPSIDITDPELDPRLAANYDQENPWREDDEFFLGLVRSQPGSRVVDIGCGTGRLTVAIAQAGHPVTGVDPNPSFLAIVRDKPGAERVAWLRGTSLDLPAHSYDVALMTSHVAQVFLTDQEWARVLREIHASLVPGGRLAFDSRDPAARAWEGWMGPQGGYVGEQRCVLPSGSVMDSVTTMTFENDTAIAGTFSVLSDGSRAYSPEEREFLPGTTWSQARWAYRFRSAELIQDTLQEAGFRVEHLYGGWHREPLGEGVGEIVVVARR